MNQKSKSEEYVQVVPLGGAGGVNKNMFVYETGKDIIVVDCGIDFPEIESEEERLGVPDISYLKKKRNKIRGIIISHAHEDHYGALPYLLPKGLKGIPVFAGRLTQEFLKEKLRELKIAFPKFQLLSGKKNIQLGDFKISPFRVNHSVPDSLGFCLQTPVGKIFHVADFKLDLTPVDGKRFDFQRIGHLSQGKTLALFSDCLGATEEGFTKSEKEIKSVFEQILVKSKGQVFITTLSSNLSRIQQAIDASVKLGRKVCLLGYSIERSVDIARRLGYVRVAKKNLISQKKAGRMPPAKITYLAAGSYGQSNSSLAKIGRGKYRGVKLLKDDAVIFSADPAPPGTKDRVDRLVDRLTLLGARVYYYEIQENLHVSGHGSKEDLKLLLALVRPKFAIPIGGNPRHQRAYRFLAEEMEVSLRNIFELVDGEILRFANGQAQRKGKIKLKDVFVGRRE